MTDNSGGAKSWRGSRNGGGSPGNRSADAESIDLLALWIAEDVVACAKSSDLMPEDMLEQAVAKVRVESLLEKVTGNTKEEGEILSLWPKLSDRD